MGLRGSVVPGFQANCEVVYDMGVTERKLGSRSIGTAS